MKEVTDIIDKIDTLKKQFEENKQKISEIDIKIQEVIMSSDNIEALENMSQQIVHLKEINENIDETILELERRLEILNRYKIESL